VGFWAENGVGGVGKVFQSVKCLEKLRKRGEIALE
jgi:hypothetical protein